MRSGFGQASDHACHPLLAELTYVYERGIRMSHNREELRAIRAANIKRFERLLAVTDDNEQRASLMELLAAEREALDQLTTGTPDEESEPLAPGVMRA